jgi:branched-chain amino acid aminotransferase
VETEIAKPTAGQQGLAFVNGEFCPLERASIPILDLGFLRSDACQDTVSVWRGSFFWLDAHLKRFSASCAALRLECPYSDEELTDLLSDLVARSNLPNAYVQMIMLRGQVRAGSRDIRTCSNHFAAFALPYVNIVPDGGTGSLNLIVSDRPRIASASVPSGIKNYHWIDFELGLLEAYDRGGNTVVLSDEHGNISEGPGFNVFCVKDGKIATPQDNVLSGITREVIGELAKELGIDFAHRAVTKNEIRNADEVFISSTAGGVMPIASVDGMQMPGAAPGSMCDRISKLYWSRRAEGWRGLAINYALPGDMRRSTSVSTTKSEVQR